MDEIFEKLIYNSEEEKQKVHKECIGRVVGYYNLSSTFKQASFDEVERELAKVPLDTDLENTSARAFATYSAYTELKDGIESRMLLNYVRKNGADKLWSGKAWQNKTCKRRCPFGEMCNKDVLSIDGTKMCYGQLLSRDLTFEKVKTLETGGSEIERILNNGDISEYSIESFFESYESFMDWFGQKKWPKRFWVGKGVSEESIKRFYGGNVLIPLLRKMEQEGDVNE